MRLVKLVHCDMLLDGGSYSASWSTDGEQEYGLWLQRSRMPDDAGLHHGLLFEYLGERRAPNCAPVVSGSEQEQQLLARLDEFLREPKVTPANLGAGFANLGAGFANLGADYFLRRLREMRGYIARRQPCSLKVQRHYLSLQETWSAVASDDDAGLHRER